MDVNPFRQCTLDFPRLGRHLMARTAVEDAHFRSAQTNGNPRGVDGHIPATDNDDPPLNTGEFTQVCAAQESNPGHHPFGVLTGYVQPLAAMGTDSQIYGLKPLSKQIAKGEIPAQSSVEVDFHPQPGDQSDFLVQNRRRQAIVRNAHPQHAARCGKRFEDGYLIAIEGQEIGRAEPCGTGTDNRYVLAALPDYRQGKLVEIYAVGHKTLQSANRDRTVDLSPAACSFTGMGTDPADDTRQGEGSQDELQSLNVFPLSDQSYIALSVDEIGAGIGAGRPVSLVDGKSCGDCLCIGFVDGFSQRETLLEFIDQRNRADPGAIPASGALVGIDIPGFLEDRRPESSRLSFQAL